MTHFDLKSLLRASVHHRRPKLITDAEWQTRVERAFRQIEAAEASRLSDALTAEGIEVAHFPSGPALTFRRGASLLRAISRA